MLKKIVMTAAMLFSAAVMTGCFGGMEVNDRAFVQLMGLEKQDGLYLATLQIYRSESGSSDPDTTKANSISVSGTGETVSSALADAELKTGKKLFLGHIKMLIIGSGIDAPSDELALFTDSRVSPSCPVVYSESPSEAAGTLLEEGTFSAEHFIDMMETSSAQGKTIFTSAAEVISRTGASGKGAAIPNISADSEKKTVKFDGLVFINHDDIYGGIAAENVYGVKLLKNKFERDDMITVPVSVNGRKAAVAITDSDTRLRASVNDGRLRISADISIRIKVAENPYGILDETIEKAVRERVQDVCTDVFSAAVWRSSCDIFGIDELVRKYCPDIYGEYCSDTSKYLSESSLSLKITSRLG